jgi:hypothetical protein
MQPIEIWWWLDHLKPSPEYCGGMSEDDVADIYYEAYGDG